MQVERNRLSLKGYKGTVPNPMKNGTDEDGNRVILDKGQNPQYIPTIDDTGHTIAIRASSKNEAYQIALKKLKRKNIPKKKAKEILKNSKVVYSDKIWPNIRFKGQVDTEALKLEFLKIAFEYMNKEYGDMYRNDPIGNDLKNILNHFKSGSKVDFSKYLSDIPKEGITPLKNAIQRRGINIHYIQFLLTDDERLFMNILLFNGNYSQKVLVSNCGNEYPKIYDKKIAVVIK